MRLHVYLGEDFYCGKNVLRFPEEEFFFEAEKWRTRKHFWTYQNLAYLLDLLWRVPVPKGGLVKILCDFPYKKVIWKLLNTRGWIFSACMITFSHKTAEIHSLSLTPRWVEIRTEWCDSSRPCVITT